MYQAVFVLVLMFSIPLHAQGPTIESEGVVPVVDAQAEALRLNAPASPSKRRLRALRVGLASSLVASGGFIAGSILSGSDGSGSRPFATLGFGLASTMSFLAAPVFGARLRYLKNRERLWLEPGALGRTQRRFRLMTGISFGTSAALLLAMPIANRGLGDSESDTTGRTANRVVLGGFASISALVGIGGIIRLGTLRRLNKRRNGVLKSLDVNVQGAGLSIRGTF